MKNKLTQFILIILGLVSCIVWSIALYPYDPYLHIHFIDIGQGDAIFIRTPQLQSVVIDGGPGKEIVRYLGSHVPFWDRGIDMMIHSHPHTDHLIGLLELLATNEVRAVAEQPVDYHSHYYEKWISYRDQGSIPFYTAQTLQEVSNSDGTFSLTFIAPIESHENINNDSLIVRLRYHDFSLLLVGDTEIEREQSLLDQGAFLDSDVLKAGHHGSKTSSSPLFLEQVSPLVSIISAGEDNKYKHPHQETLDLYEANNIVVYRTDKLGSIELITDGKGFSVHGEKGSIAI